MVDCIIEIPEDHAQTVAHTKENQLLARDQTFVTSAEKNERTLNTHRASSKYGSRVGIILVGPQGNKLTYALRFEFSCCKNEAEYEALLTGLQLARSMKVFYIGSQSD